MNVAFTEHLRSQLRQLEADGLLKRERVITSPQGAWIEADGRRVVNFCANNYLGLAGHPDLVAAARDGARPATATASPRCGSSAAPRTSTRSSRRGSRASSASRTRSSSPPASTRTAACSRRSSARRTRSSPTRSTTRRSSTASGSARRSRYRYANGDMADLEAQLRAAEAGGARFKLVVTDGVFSMDGDSRTSRRSATSPSRHGALVMVDDSHAVGFVGEQGRGTPEHCGVDGPGRHRHRHARQGARRRLRRLRGGVEGDRRAAPPARAPLPLLEHARPGHRGGEPRRPRPARGGRRAPPTSSRRTRGTSAPG